MRSGHPPAGNEHGVREYRLSVEGAELYVREVGAGPVVVIVHGGPDFDHGYLLPELDRLSDICRLVYYDQRGRGRSATNVRPADVDVASDVEDLNALTHAVSSRPAAVLGHSWGALLALEQALRHPDTVSGLILVNPAPVSYEDHQDFRADRRARLGDSFARLQELADTDAFHAGDPDAVATYYRLHFQGALARDDDLDRVVTRLRAGFTPPGVLLARQVEDRLMQGTLWRPDYTLVPRLARLTVPALVLRGTQDFIPLAAAQHIARSLPEARLVELDACGHFAYLEQPEEVHRHVSHFLAQTTGR